MRTRVIVVGLLGLMLASSANRLLAQPNTGAQDARKRLTDAQKELTKAQAALTAATAKVKAEFQKSDDWTKAQGEVKQAQQDLEAARKAVSESLKAKPEYQKALAEKKKADDEKEALRAEGASTEKIMDAATRALAANAAVVKLETDAVAADPKAAEAKKRLADATAIFTALQKQLELSLKTNPDLEQPRKDVETATERVKQAAKDLAEARKKY